MNAGTLLEIMKPNLIKRHSLDKELIVSLTSYPKRFNILPLTIQSLLNQSVKPDRIILWLYKGDYKLLPSTVKNLEKFGLQILLIDEDWKSYKKIIPSLLQFPDAFIVTCDDDVLYKPTVVEELVEGYKANGGVIAHRAHIIQFDNKGNLLPYLKWQEKTPPHNFIETNSPLVFSTGVGGVLYPPNCLHESVIDIEKAMELCPTADDIWLFFMASLNSTNASLIGGRGFINLNQDENDSLWAINSQGENDRQLENLINEFGMPKSLENEINKACQNISAPNTVKLVNGTCMQVKHDHIGRIISKTAYFYEHDLIAYVKRYLSPKRVVDVGTNIGNHALGFAGHPDYKVVCFEPDSGLAEVARSNLEMNSIDNEIYNHGLGEKEEELPFIFGSIENTGVGKFDRNMGSSKKLPVKRMDDCISEEFEVDLIKIDVEGFELDVLLGAENTIKSNEPVLIINHVDYDHYLRCKDVICEFGYIPVEVFCATPTFVYVKQSADIHHAQANTATWVDCWTDFTQTHPNQ